MSKKDFELVTVSLVEDPELDCRFKTTVVNKQTDEYDVYIGRGSKWGNPFMVGIHGTRKQCIEKYRKYLLDNNILLDDIEELRGQRLGCYCKPLACHGDVLVELLNDL